MSDKALISIHAMIYAIFALALFFLPDLMWPMYGMEINDKYARFLSQHNSIFLFGIAAFAWLFRDANEYGSTARKVLTGLLLTNVMGVVVTLFACLKGVFSGFGWSDPAFFALLAVLCFLQLRKTIAKQI